MFTGLIEGIGIIKSVNRSGGDMSISVLPSFEMNDCRIGDSVAVNGVCLTVTHIQDQIIKMDVSRETIASSCMGFIRQGDSVNLERALRLSDRLGGHIVSGHVDGKGSIIKKTKIQGSWLFRIGIEKSNAKYIVEKGSVAVDGISLTINHCRESWFEVNIIPETARETNLMDRKVGEYVNIETDLIAKYIEKLIRKERSAGKDNALSKIDMEMLNQHGFGD